MAGKWSAGYLLWVLPICVYPAVGQTLTTLYSFQGTPDGGFPFSDVLLTKGGTLYSTTSGGGSNGAGSVFELVPPSQPGGEWTDKLLVSLPGGSGGGMPFAGVVEDDSGAFYSANAGTPPNELGNIFQVAPADGGQSWTYNIIWHFNGSDGATPQADLLYRGGVFYGTTTAGGAHNRGTIFMLAPPATAGGSWTHTLLYSFSNGVDGGYPFSSLLMDSERRAVWHHQSGRRLKGWGDGVQARTACSAGDRMDADYALYVRARRQRRESLRRSGDG